MSATARVDKCDLTAKGNPNDERPLVCRQGSLHFPRRACNAVRKFRRGSAAVSYIKDSGAALYKGATLEEIVPNVAVPRKDNPATASYVANPFGIREFWERVSFREVVGMNFNIESNSAQCDRDESASEVTIKKDRV